MPARKSARRDGLYAELKNGRYLGVLVPNISAIILKDGPKKRQRRPRPLVKR